MVIDPGMKVSYFNNIATSSHFSVELLVIYVI